MTTDSTCQTSTSEQSIPMAPTDHVSLSPIASTSNLFPETPRKRKLRKIICQKNKQIKRLQSRTRYLVKKVASLKEILDTLTKKSLLDKENRQILELIGVEESELIKRQIVKSKTGKLPRTKYSPELRCFALTLNYYSPKAYRYVRKTFGTCLPAPRTLSKWYSTISGRPGFTNEALSALKLRVESNPDKKIYCSLIIDEMKIKEFTEYNASTERHYGYVDYGFDFISDNSDKATDALVFLLVGINTTWKVPIGYFLIKGITAQLKARLVTIAFKLVHEAGIEIKALTCDGTKSNLAMAEELGCCLDPQNLQTKILDHQTGQQIFFFLDPCHMLKLIRNAFEFYGYFIQNESGQKIEWSYIQKLHQLQENEMFYLANKLKANHIYFKSKIMNVCLAAQLFSQSVADALLFCNNVMKMTSFEQVTATAEFVKLVNDLFDILDSKTWSKAYKQALNLKNYERAFARLDEAKAMLQNLSVVITRGNTLKTINILKSPRHTGFLGFCVCIESAKNLFKSLVLDQGGTLTYLPLHKISQDHVEIFFSNVRSHGGYNDNPTARQLEAIYKKLLVHTELNRNERGTNCIPLEKISILDCSSAIKKINDTSMQFSIDLEASTESSITEDQICADIDSFTYLSPFGEEVVKYIAGYVVFSTIKKIKCSLCIKGLLGEHCEKSLIHQKSRGGLMYASEDVISLCRFCEFEIKTVLTPEKKVNPKYNTKRIVTQTLKKLIGKTLFSCIEEHYFDNEYVPHNIELAKVVMEKYTNTRITYLSKRSDPKKCIRHIYTKLIHFKNQ